MDQTNSTNASLLFSTEGSGTLSERLRIDSSGDIDLSIAAANNATRTVSLRSDYGGGTFFDNAALALVQDSSGSSGGHLQFLTTASGGSSPTERLRIDSSGRLGVGLTPSSTASITNVDAGLIQTDGNIDIRYPGTNSDPAGTRYLSFVNTDSTLVANQPMGGIRWVGNDTSNPSADSASILAINEGSGGASSHITFNTGGTERVRIDSSGNVGIATTSPSAPLAFGKSDYGEPSSEDFYRIKFKDNGGTENDVGIGMPNANSLGFNSVSNGSIRFYTGTDGESMRIDDSGNVGIGTSSPAGNLQISGSGDRSLLITGGTSGTTSVQMGDSSDVDAGAILYDNSNNSMQFKTNASERMRIDNSGRLLVGTSSFTGEAGVVIEGSSAGEATQGQLWLNRGATPLTDHVLGMINFGDNNAAGRTGAMIQARADLSWNANDYPSRLAFFTTADNASSPTERVRIDRTGAVKYFGNSSSAWVLYAASDTTSYSQLDAHFPASNRTLFFNENSSNNSYVVWNRNSGSSGKGFGLEGQNFKVVQGASEQLRVDSSGNVGINHSSPQFGLTIGQSANNIGKIGWEDGSNNKRASITCSSSTDALQFHVGTSDTERMRIATTGYAQFGGYLAETNNHRINGIGDTQGDVILVVSGYQASGGSTQDTAKFFAVNSGGNASSSAAAIVVYRNTGTNRSINTAGTINASGADYAEYMTKAGDFTLAKGDICGINSEGKLTNVFADAISFVVKSTDPSYVGGDTWHTAAGEKPGGYDDDRTEEEIAAATVVYEEALEAARQLVDRIAFSGQVPVNVTGATPGQHIIPTAAADGSIEGTAKAEADLTMAEYMSSVGKVIAIEDDGRAKIIVKVA